MWRCDCQTEQTRVSEVSEVSERSAHLLLARVEHGEGDAPGVDQLFDHRHHGARAVHLARGPVLRRPRPHARTHARMHARTHAWTHARTQARKHARTHARTHASKYARTQACTDASKQARTHASMHARTHERQKLTKQRRWQSVVAGLRPQQGRAEEIVVALPSYCESKLLHSRPTYLPTVKYVS